MTVTLYNLTSKEKWIAQTIWGTDDVVDLHEANEIIDRFRKL